MRPDTREFVIAACGFVSTLLAVCCGIPYLRSVMTGRTQPHQFSWLIFVIMNGIVTGSQFLEGGRWSVLVSATFFVYSAGICVLSLKLGSRDTSRYDRMLLALSLGTIVVWVLTKNNAVAIWLTVLIDIFASTMIVLKVSADPGSEDPKPWAIGAAAYVFSCIALTQTSPGVLYVRPIYGLVTDLVLALAPWWFGRRARPVKAA